jgi:membrane-bound lytic murein transglycosylase A
VAADPAFVPLGAPIFLDVAHDIADGLWVAQDTGGAIQGSNRFDTFWGAGEEAHRIAGGMASRGRALILIPNVSAERLRRDR